MATLYTNSDSNKRKTWLLMSGFFIFIFLVGYVFSYAMNDQGILIFAVIFGTLGNTVGNIILYELARQKGLQYITKFKIFPVREIRKVEVAFRRRGAWFLFIGKTF